MESWCSQKGKLCLMANEYGYCQSSACCDMSATVEVIPIDYSANGIVNTTTNAKWNQTDGKDHPDWGIPLHIPQNESIVITSEAVFIKPLKLVVITEDVYNKLKGERK